MTHQPDSEAGDKGTLKNRKRSQVARGRWRQWKALSAKPVPGFHEAQQCQAPVSSLPLPAFPEGARKTPGSTYQKIRVCLADQECLPGQIRLPLFLLSHLWVFLRKKKKRESEQRPEGHCLEIPTQNLNYRIIKTLYFLMKRQVKANPLGLCKVRVEELIQSINQLWCFSGARSHDQFSFKSTSLQIILFSEFCREILRCSLDVY